MFDGGSDGEVEYSALECSASGRIATPAPLSTPWYSPGDGRIPMYCPKCGDELQNVRGALTCLRGDMPLSPSLSAAFTEIFVHKSRTAPCHRNAHLISGAWYCPGCGIPLVEELGSTVCPRCNQSLDEFLFPLIELHPHTIRR